MKKGKALTRKDAKVGDVICVSDALGDGAVGLAAKAGQLHLQVSSTLYRCIRVN